MTAGLMPVAEYLARAVTARPVYDELWKASLVILPPLPLVEANVECCFTARDLARRLATLSYSQVQNELRWLENNGWLLNRAASARFLGRRDQGIFYLMADVAAKAVTGEERLVSREVLGIALPAPPVTEETAARVGRRGAGREWSGG